MPHSARPYAAKQFADIDGRRMAYIDAGTGPAIVFQHGNPTSSYLWRNVMPAACQGLGRLVACDLIGMGDSDKLGPSGPDRYGYAEQRRYLWALWDTLRSATRSSSSSTTGARRWASSGRAATPTRRRPRLHGGAGGAVAWADWPENARRAFQGFRSPAGDDMILARTCSWSASCRAPILRKLTDEEMAEYRRPTPTRRGPPPTLSWPRQIPIEGEPPMW
jgi:haloalkane dehalogenase